MKKQLNILGLTALAALPAGNVCAQVASKPNVIYIMADDLGIGDLGCYGQKIIKTPGIDSLAKNGMIFTQHYSGSTVSAPSRCALLTGKHTGNAYIRGNMAMRCSDGETYDHPLPAEEITVADIFKKQGYTTACVGKWGLGGPGTEGEPRRHGFDYFYGYLGQAHAHRYYPSFLWENETKLMLDKKVYSHDLIMEKARDFIERSSNEPFFLYLTPTIPHADLIVPEGELGMYENMFCETPFPGPNYTPVEKTRATYAAMVSRLDRDVNLICELLKDKGIFDNTIIIFTSDNGVHAEGGHDPDFFNSNGPFRGIKRDLYEGGVRTPFVVSWPAVIQPGSVSFHRSAFWDFLATVCDIVGEAVPVGTDGISYLPALSGKDEQRAHEYLYWEFFEGGGKRAILKEGWKLIELFVNQPERTRFELYNIHADPGERADVANTMPFIVEELKKTLYGARTPSKNWKFKFEQ